jgi:hypothetical protein
MEPRISTYEPQGYIIYPCARSPYMEPRISTYEPQGYIIYPCACFSKRRYMNPRRYPISLYMEPRFSTYEPQGYIIYPCACFSKRRYMNPRGIFFTPTGSHPKDTSLTVSFINVFEFPHSENYAALSTRWASLILSSSYMGRHPPNRHLWHRVPIIYSLSIILFG